MRERRKKLSWVLAAVFAVQALVGLYVAGYFYFAEHSAGFMMVMTYDPATGKSAPASVSATFRHFQSKQLVRLYRPMVWLDEQWRGRELTITVDP